jgi:hypothetical protein
VDTRSRFDAARWVRAVWIAAVALTMCTIGMIDTTALATEPAQPVAHEVTRAQFTSRVQDREPIDLIERMSADRQLIFFYSELQGLAGKTVSHRWEHEGNTMADVPFRVDANRWRVWSSKNLKPGWLGTWTVSIVSDDGSILATRSFTYHQ